VARTWKDNAHEYGALVKQGEDVRLALLVACSVTKRNGQGQRTDLLPDGKRSADEKVSGVEFAKEALGTKNPNRVLRHLAAWDRIADPAQPYGSLVLASADLRPRDAEGLRAFKGDDSWLTDTTGWQAVFEDTYDASKAGTRPRSPVSEIDGALVGKDGYAAKLVDGLSDEGFAALVQAVDAVAHPAAVEPDPDLPEPPAAKPTKKRRIVDDWAAEKAKRDLAERQARLDAELERIKLDAIAGGGKVPDQVDSPDVTMESMFGARFGAWTAIGLDGVARRLSEFRATYGDLYDEEMDVLRKYAVGLLDIAAGTHVYSEVGGVVPR